MPRLLAKSPQKATLPQKSPIWGALIPPGLNAKAKKRPEPQMVEGGDELLNSHWELLFCILPLCSAMLSEDLLSHWRSGTVAALMDDYSILIAKWNIKIWFLFGKYNWNFRSWTLGTVVGKPNFCHWVQFTCYSDEFSYLFEIILCKRFENTMPGREGSKCNTK